MVQSFTAFAPQWCIILVDLLKVLVDSHKRMLTKTLVTHPAPQKQRGPLPPPAMPRNLFRGGKTASIPQIEESVAEMLDDVEDNLIGLRSTLQTGTAAEADRAKAMMRMDFDSMITATQRLQKIVKDQMEKGTYSKDELLTLKTNTDAMSKKTSEIRQDLIEMKPLSLQSASKRLSPEVVALAVELTTLQVKAEYELNSLNESSKDAILEACEKLQTSLSYAKDGAEDVKGLLGAIDGAVECEDGEARKEVLSFEAHALASFVKRYRRVFGKDDIVLPKREEDPDPQENPDSQENVDSQENEGETTEEINKGSEEEVDLSESKTSQVIGDLKTSAKSDIPEKDDTPDSTSAAKGKASTIVISGIIGEIDRTESAGGSGGGSRYGSGGGGGWSDDEEEGEGEGDDAVKPETIVWWLVLLCAAYLLVLPLSLEAHKYVSEHWINFKNRRSGLPEGSPPVDDSTNSSAGGVVGWLPAQTRGGRIVPARKKPIDGYVLTGALFGISIILVRGLSAA